jgi:hypothetical protein
MTLDQGNDNIKKSTLKLDWLFHLESNRSIEDYWISVTKNASVPGCDLTLILEKNLLSNMQFWWWDLWTVLETLKLTIDIFSNIYDGNCISVTIFSKNQSRNKEGNRSITYLVNQIKIYSYRLVIRPRK